MQKNLSRVSTREVKSWINDRNIAMIDIRPIAAYNGWTPGAEARGGHIPGARSLPLKWADFIDWIEIVRHKEILPEHKIVIYGYTDQEVLKVADRFQGAGYQDINIYSDFVQQWAADPTLPLEKMKRYRHLVYPDWVHQLISGESPPEYAAGSHYVICHAHYRNEDDYLLGHIPGAIALDTLELESPDSWNRRSPQELKAALQKHGITSNTTVVLYGRYSFPDNNDPFPGSSAGQLAAIRCALIMLYAGVKDVRLLNGGMATWETENKPVETTPHTPAAVADFGATIPAHPELIVDMEEARQLLQATDGELVCTRSWPEYIGEVSGYNYIAKKGRIPGAVYVNNGSDAYNMENYQNLDYTTRQYSEIVDMWKQHGLGPDKHLAFYCGTGWRGSEAFINAWLLGWPRVSVFDGGWFEWSNDESNPIETGIPEQVSSE